MTKQEVISQLVPETYNLASAILLALVTLAVCMAVVIWIGVRIERYMLTKKIQHNQGLFE